MHLFNDQTLWYGSNIGKISGPCFCIFDRYVKALQKPNRQYLWYLLHVLCDTEMAAMWAQTVIGSYSQSSLWGDPRAGRWFAGGTSHRAGTLKFNVVWLTDKTLLEQVLCWLFGRHDMDFNIVCLQTRPCWTKFIVDCSVSTTYNGTEVNPSHAEARLIQSRKPGGQHGEG